MAYWTPNIYDDGIYVTLIDADGTVLKRHPIAFPNDREALRGAARLNARDAELEEA
jgi:hypothetical protein